MFSSLWSPRLLPAGGATFSGGIAQQVVVARSQPQQPCSSGSASTMCAFEMAAPPQDCKDAYADDRWPGQEATSAAEPVSP